MMLHGSPFDHLGEMRLEQDLLRLVQSFYPGAEVQVKYDNVTMSWNIYTRLQFHTRVLIPQETMRDVVDPNIVIEYTARNIVDGLTNEMQNTLRRAHEAVPPDFRR